MEIDQTSRRIIAILQRDGRCPNTVIARELGVSEAAVRARIQALTSSGILQIIGPQGRTRLRRPPQRPPPA